MSDIPQWALDKARRLRDERFADKVNRTLCPMDEAFARYIAEHEEPPVDPPLLEAREIAASYAEAAGDYASANRLRGGQVDHWAYAEIALAGIKRGMELAGEQP